MTTIDVATGDLSGWSSYAGDRAVPVVASHYGQAQAATNQTSDVLEGSVADADETIGEQTRQGPMPTGAVPEDQVIPLSPGATGKSPTGP